MHSAIVPRSGADRRRDRRVLIGADVDVRISGMDMRIHATLEDLSAGGCRLRLRIPLRFGSAVRIELPQPGRAALVLPGNVVRASSGVRERTYHYGVRFRAPSHAERTSIIAYLALFARSQSAGSTVERREPSAMLDVKVACRVSTPGDGDVSATILRLGTSGMRVACDRVFRQEWSMKCDVKLPGEVSISSTIVTVTARALPGVRSVRGQFVTDLAFGELPLRARIEIERYLDNVRRERVR